MSAVPVAAEASPVQPSAGSSAPPAAASLSRGKGRTLQAVENGRILELPRAQGIGVGWAGRIRAVWILLKFLVFTLALLPVQIVALRLGWPLANRLPGFYHRRLCRILDLRVERIGVPVSPAPTLIVANHTSWLDIPVMSAAMRASFVAKSEVAGWPGFGTLARLQRTVFVERERRTKAQEQSDEIGNRLAQGDRLILFPEGTSNDGNRVLNFKSSLFAVADRAVQQADGTSGPLVVQPVSVTYTRVNGMPMGRDLRPFFAWYGDMDLAPHLWQALQFGPVTVVIEFHPPVTLAQFSSRKTLAAHCEAAVRDGVARALAGRDAPPPVKA
ncbi:lysophospholipid acyltransferase family protein [Zavarzinia sp. CC-PAN008]|uniref:lysophospholipid acyltransferase family protein n=1 Tax=Zavarzinia sp. CC-PAN008 TaxID=3243332 RepID=UPI003F742C1B